MWKAFVGGYAVCRATEEILYTAYLRHRQSRERMYDEFVESHSKVDGGLMTTSDDKEYISNNIVGEKPETAGPQCGDINLRFKDGGTINVSTVVDNGYCEYTTIYKPSIGLPPHMMASMDAFYRSLAFQRYLKQDPPLMLKHK